MDSRIEIRSGRFINLCVYPHPSSDTTFFLLHGLGGRGTQWREQINALKDKYTLVIPDLLGHGKSDKPQYHPRSQYCFAEFDNDVKMIFSRFCNEKNIVMGHSYGGTLATSLTMDNQDRIQQLILIAPLPNMPAASTPVIYKLPTLVLEGLRPWLEKNFQRLAFDKSADSCLMEYEMKAGRTCPMYVIRSMVTDLKNIPQLDISMLNTPTLIISGVSDGIVPTPLQHNFYQSLKHHQFITMEHTAHMVMLEQPIKVNEALQHYVFNPNN